MNNIERLLNGDNRDKVLAEYIVAVGVVDLVNASNFNRGDFFEMCLTKTKVKRDGLHGVSQGDGIINGVLVEIKYLTTKTGASKDLQGTIANYYLIGFNNGKEIKLKIIHKNDLVAVKSGDRLKITYQNNINKGTEWI